MTKKHRSREAGDSHATRTSSAAPTLTRVPEWAIVVVLVATVLAYAPALSAPFVMDDIPGIVENMSVRRFVPSEAVKPGDVAAGNPVAGRPVANLTLAANYAINHLLGVDQRPDPDGPFKTVGYRLFNILIHLFTGGLLFGVMRRAMRARVVPEDWRSEADWMAGTACALWLLHPIQSEAINYVVQRTELLASMFYVATLYASIRAWDAATTGGRFRWYAAAIVACALGIGSKEIAISAPLAVVLYDRAFRLPTWKAMLRPTHGRPWFYLALTGVCLVSFAFIAAGGRGLTAGFNADIPWYRYLYSQCWAIAHYLRLVVWPNALTVDYGTNAITGVRGVPGAILLSACGLATLLAWTRVSLYGWLAFLGSWFFMLLAPSSSVMPITTEIAAERRIYLALAAVFVLVVVGAEWTRRRFISRISSRELGLGLGGVALVLATTTAFRSLTYSSPERLWRDAMRKDPENLRAVVNLGAALTRQRPPRYAEAESLYRYAISRDSTCHFGCVPLANAYAAQGNLAAAVPLLERAVAFEPAFAPTERRLALILMKTGSYDLAAPHLAHVASEVPTESHLAVLGVVYYALGRQRDAMNTFDEAIRLYPTNAEIRRLGGTLYVASRSPDAAPHLKELALKLAEGWE